MEDTEVKGKRTVSLGDGAESSNIASVKRRKDGFHVASFTNTQLFDQRFQHDIWGKLSQAHKDLLADWPFKHFLENMPTISMSRNFLNEFFFNYDKDRDGFVYFNELFRTTDNDISLILGLRARGDPIQPRPTKTTIENINSKIHARFFPGETTLKFKQLEAVLLREIEDDATATPEEWVSLLTIYFMSLVLFPRINWYVPMHLFQYVDDLKKLWDYAWGPAVHKDISSMYEQLSNTVKEHYRTGKYRSPGLQGCDWSLLVFLFEHTRPSLAGNGHKLTPRYRNWNMNYHREREFEAVFRSVKLDDMILGELLPEHNESWIFIEDSKLARYAYLNPVSLDTPRNIITTHVTNKAIGFNNTVEIAEVDEDLPEGQVVDAQLLQPTSSQSVQYRVRNRPPRNPLSSYVRIDGVLYKWSGFPQDVRHEFYIRCQPSPRQLQKAG